MKEKNPVFVSENKIKIKLNNMEKNIFYPVEYKNKKYLIVNSEDGVIDLYTEKLVKFKGRWVTKSYDGINVTFYIPEIKSATCIECDKNGRRRR